MPLGETPGADYSKLPAVTSAGVDFDTLEQDAFPQLKMENTLLVQKLFQELQKSLDIKTSKFYFLN